MAKLNATKRRVIDEFQAQGQFAWVTKGREIENYIDDNVLDTVLRSRYKNFSQLAEPGQFGCVTEFYEAPVVKGAEAREADKIALARDVCSKPVNLSVLDLKEQLANLVAAIRMANDYPITTSCAA